MTKNKNLQFLDGLDPRQRAFIMAYRQCGKITQAADEVGMTRQNHYQWMEQPKYKSAFYQCRDSVCDHIENSLVQRLIDGVEEPIFQGGELVGHKTKHDNAAAIRYLEKINPVFKDDTPADADKLEPVPLIDVMMAMRATVPGKPDATQD